MTVFFTSDTHFGHRNIIKYCNRPFVDEHEMDEAIIKNWNLSVKPNDTVWHLGDFSLSKHKKPESYLSQLNGKIHLTWGNHDHSSVRNLSSWASSQAMAEINVDGRHLVLCHYAMRTWNKAHHGSLMFYGHTHGSLPGNRHSLDVGVDAWDFRPVALDEILQRLETLPVVLI